MDWESLYGNSAQYTELLREIERENYARRVWASTHPRRNWWGLGRRLGHGLVGWFIQRSSATQLRDRKEDLVDYPVNS